MSEKEQNEQEVQRVKDKILKAVDGEKTNIARDAFSAAFNSLSDYSVISYKKTPLDNMSVSNGVNVEDVVAAIETFISDLGKNARRVPYE